MIDLVITSVGEVDIELIWHRGEQWLRKQDVISWLAICAKDSDDTGKAIFNALISRLEGIKKQ